MNTPKKKRIKLLDPMRDGKGVEKGEDTTPTLKRFFKLFGRKFWRLITVNFVMLVQILPLLGCLFLYVGGPKVATQYSPLYPALLGAQTAMPTTVGSTLFNGASGLAHTMPIFNSWAHWVMLGLLLFQVLTYGWQKVGSTYILRNMVRGEGVFIFSDFFYAIRRNWKQGLIVGILDCVAIGTLTYNILFFYAQAPSGFTNFMYAMTVAIILIYIIMRFYIYLMLVTFDMKIFKMYKNALIFTVLGIRRNLMALLGIAALIGIFVLMLVFLLPLKFYAALILPFLCLLGFSGFMYTYAAYPVIEKYMIGAPAPSPVPATPEDSAE